MTEEFISQSDHLSNMVVDDVHQILAERIRELEGKLEISMDMNVHREELLNEKTDEILKMQRRIRFLTSTQEDGKRE